MYYTYERLQLRGRPCAAHLVCSRIAAVFAVTPSSYINSYNGFRAYAFVCHANIKSDVRKLSRRHSPWGKKVGIYLCPCWHCWDHYFADGLAIAQQLQFVEE